MADNKIKDKNLHAGHRSRIRERARKDGLRNFNEHQVLEYLLSFVVARKDTNDLAHQIINEFGNLANVLDSPYEALMNVKGISDVSATFLSTLPQIFEYYNKIKFGTKPKITNTKQALDVLTPILSKLGNEQLILVLLDANDKLIHYEILNSGETNNVTVKMSEIQTIVQKYNSKKVIFAHNHPNDNFGPSKNDISFTKTTLIGLNLLGIELLDHYIVLPDGTYYSFRSYGELDNYKKELCKLLED